MSNFEWKQIEESFLEALLEGEGDQSVEIASNTLKQGATPVEFFENAIAPSLARIGGLFEELDIFLPEMVTAADIVNRVNVEVINPAVEASGAEKTKAAGKVVLATVQGDLHDIGKNMVALLLRVNGFEVIDLGINVPPSDIVARAIAEKVDIIGLSTLLTTCLPYSKDVYDYLEGKGVRDQFAIIIGGAAVNEHFADEVGADGIGHSGADAVRICKEIMAAR